MPLQKWFHPPRSLLTLYLTGAATAIGCLIWLATRLLAQTVAVENDRARARLEAVADRATVASQRLIAQLERDLATESGDLPADLVLLTADASSIRVRPDRGLAFLPIATLVDAGDEAFRAGEWAEFGSEGPAGAVSIYRALGRVDNPAVRAGALARLGRVLRKLGRQAEALEVYARLEEIETGAIAARPPNLFAREARCSVLEETRQRELLKNEANRLRNDLLAGHWPIGAPLWEYLFAEVNTWSGAPSLQGEPPALALARVATEFWTNWEQRKYSARAIAFGQPGPALALWESTGSGVRVLFAGSSYLTALVRDLGDEEVQVALLGSDNHSLAGTMGSQPVTRAVPATGLPWHVVASLVHPGQPMAEARSQTRLLLAGLATVGLLILLSGYFTFRGIRRELATARMQSDFVAAVSHEFRTPLTSIVQLSRMLHEGRVLEEGRRPQYYEALVAESERLHRLVERLLSFGRADAGRYRFEPIDAGELAVAVVDQFRKHNDVAGVDVQTASPCRIRADREMLSLALWNLLDNAAKYSPSGRVIHVGVSRDGTSAHIAVRDEGVGIADGDRARIFDRFVRGGPETTRDKPGTGIGLALARQVVEAHRGEIRLASEVGAGSTFTIVIPEEAA